MIRGNTSSAVPRLFWRRDGASFSAKFLDTATGNARRALAESYAKGDRAAIVGEALSPDLHRIRFDLVRSEWPLVSVIIPSRDALPLISKILDGLTRVTDYPALEIIVVDNGSKNSTVLALYDKYRQGGTPFTACIKKIVQLFALHQTAASRWRKEVSSFC